MEDQGGQQPCRAAIAVVMGMDRRVLIIAFSFGKVGTLERLRHLRLGEAVAFDLRGVVRRGEPGRATEASQHLDVDRQLHDRLPIAGHADVPEAVMYAFRPVLRQLRQQRGYSLRELANPTYYDHTQIARAERGDFLAPLDRVKDLDRVLGAGGLLTALRQGDGPAPPVSEVRGLHDGEPVTLEMTDTDGKMVKVRISRRHFAHAGRRSTFIGSAPAR
ncbi:helix-turn-helix transcriptional regulator [Nonomuraea sp. B5E05]|uniref:helix-turn-helix domain-containing protein n=1 Tax=Nonomuraea sp. B5E05 TaxID=3153569 RepID=UPI0032602B4E